MLLVQHTSPGLLGEDHSLCDGSGATYIHLQLYNRSIFEGKKKNTPTVDLGPFCVPMRENGGRKDQAVIVHFTIALNR